MENINDFNKISEKYALSNEKADKKYSMLPNALNIIGPLKELSIVDVGCGDGFFTREFALRAKRVYGIDNSFEQIKEAKKNPLENVEYILADMKEYSYFGSDVIFSPFVLNYIQGLNELSSLFFKFYSGLNFGGKLVGIVDMPKSCFWDMKKFGSVKKMKKVCEGEKIEIDLYNVEELITTLYSFYHSCENLDGLLSSAGFSDISWHKPIVSSLGFERFGRDFWSEYLDKCDIAYFSARKV